MTSGTQYGVFLSYNSLEKETASWLEKQLSAAGPYIRPAPVRGVGWEKAGGRSQRAPGKTGYFAESGVGSVRFAVSGAGRRDAAFRDRVRKGWTPNSTSFSLSLP